MDYATYLNYLQNHFESHLNKTIDKAIEKQVDVELSQLHMFTLLDIVGDQYERFYELSLFKTKHSFSFMDWVKAGLKIVLTRDLLNSSEQLNRRKIA